MGMFDEKRYLTGKNGVVKEGDTFHIHNAGIAGEVRKPEGDGMIPEAFMEISKTGAEDPIRVFTTGAAIVGQIQRMDGGDRALMRNALGMPVRLGTLPSTGPNRNPAFILEPAVAQDTDSPGQTQGSSL